MLNRRTVLVAALGVMLGAVPAERSQAQAAAWWGRPSIEGFYTQLRFDVTGPSVNANGVGARFMWYPTVDTGRTGALPALLRRTGLGLYGTFTPEHTYRQDLRFSTVGVGGVADVRPFATPLAGRVDPFLSLGAGWLNTRVDAAVAPAPSPLLAESHVAFALTPGVGARVGLMRNVALQGDVRDVMTFLGDTRHNIGVGAGLRLNF
jgi:hypothetical protein